MECDLCGNLERTVKVSEDCKVFLCDPCVAYLKLLPVLVGDAICSAP